MLTETTDIIEDSTAAGHQFIEAEHLQMVVVTEQVLSSSRILLSTYEQVVFSECTFYACDFQGLTFENCVFENCIFEFSHFRACNFKNCNFSNCTWKGVSSIHSIYEGCELDLGLDGICKNGKNTITCSRRDHTTDIYINLAVAC